MLQLLSSPEIIIFLLTSIFTLVVWGVRLEGQHKHNKENIEILRAEVASLHAKHDALDSHLIKELARIREALVELKTTISFIESPKRKGPKN